MLHSAKNEAIVQWYNILSDGKGVESITDFSDGSCFTSLINTISSEFVSGLSASVELSEEDDRVKQEFIDSSDATLEKEGKGKSRRSKRSTSKTATSKAAKIQRYEEVQKFIDGFFHTQSDSFINYLDCSNGNKVELAKVAMALLSASVNCFLQSKKEKTENMFQLDTSIQEEIKECLSLFVNESNTVKVDEFQTVLSRPARLLKSRRVSQRAPEVKILETKKLESPLKDFMESPTVYKVAVRKQEFELHKLRKSLHFEESKVDELKSENKDLQQELEQTKRIMSSCKERQQKLQSDYDDLEAAKELLLHDLNGKENEVKNLKKEQESLESEKRGLMEMVEKIEIDVSALQSSNTFKDTKINDLNREISKISAELEDLKSRAAVNNNVHDESSVESAGYKIHSQNILSEIKQELRDKSDECDKWASEFSAEKQKCEKLKLQLEEEQSNKQTALDAVQELMTQLEAEKKTSLELEEQISKQNLLINQSASTTQSSATDKLATAAFLFSQLNKAYSPLIKIEKEVESSPEKLGKLWEKGGIRNISAKDPCSTVQPPDPKLALPPEKFELMKKQLVNLASTVRKNCATSNELLAPLEESCSNVDCVTKIIPFLNNLHVLMDKSTLLTTDSEEEKSKRQATSSGPGKRKKTVSPITRRGEDSFEREKRELEEKYKSLLDHWKELKATLAEKDGEIKEQKELLEDTKAEIKKITEKLEKAEQATRDANEKYCIAKKYIEKQRLENKKISAICNVIAKQSKTLEKEKEQCKKCEDLSEQLKDFRTEKTTLERKVKDLKTVVTSLVNKHRYAVREIQDLEKQNKKLEFELQTHSAFLSGKAFDRNAVILKCFKEAADKSKELSEKEQLKQPRPVVNVNTYVYKTAKKPSPDETSNSSVFTNCSIKNDDEEDFLNHSSLAEIHGGPKAEPIESRRLHELQRRNTLCPPHLQSSYPLELENTPSEKKYYEVESDEDIASFVSKKRKIESERDSSAATQRTGRMSLFKEYGKPVTPIKQTGSITRSRTFKTPSSIRRLMHISRKTKHH